MRVGTEAVVMGQGEILVRRHSKASIARKFDGSGLAGACRCLVLAAAFALILAPSAGAAVTPKGVTGFFGSGGFVAGQFSATTGVGGVAVNQSTGNIYAVDRGNNRVNVFNSSGAFTRTFGQDVVASGPDNNGTNFEVCVPASGDSCKPGLSTVATGGAMNTPQGVAVDQATNNVYVTDQGNLRVQQFDQNGVFIRAFGQDVVSTGPDDKPATSAIQTLTVTATGGKYTLAFQGQTSSELAFNATAAQIQTALQALTSVGAGNATVSETSAGVFKVTFAGNLANNPEPTIAAASAAGEPLTGGTASVASATAGATGFEVCNTTDVCKIGVTGATAGAFGATIGYPGVAPTGAPNAGDVLIADPANLRVQEFSNTGAFVRAFGFDVAKAGPGNTGVAFETCSAVNFDVCKIGVTGAGTGQFATATPTRVAEDASGNLYTVEPTTNFRVQKFTLPANVVTAGGAFDTTDLPAAAASAPSDVAIDPATSDVLVSRAFAAAATPSCPITGAASPAESRVVEISSAAVLQATHGTCAGLTPANGLAVRTSSSTGDVYFSSSLLDQRVYVLNTGQPTAPTASITNISGLSAHTATITGLVNPNGPELAYGQHTSYRLEYKRVGDPSFTVLAETDAGNRTTNLLFNQQITGLQAASTYDVRVAATKPFGSGTTNSTTTTFSTPSAGPDASTEAVSGLTPTQATISGRVNPNNVATTYRFEYTTDADFQAHGYANATHLPSVDASAGSGGADVYVTRTITGIQAGTTYHFRLTATSANGTSSSADRTFAPTACANESFRVEQGATVVTSCRAYELVSPPDGGAYGVFLPMNGTGVVPKASGARVSTSDGNGVAYVLAFNGTIEGMEIDGDGADTLVSRRGKSGWTWRPTGAIGTPCAVGVPFMNLSEDASSVLVRPFCRNDQEGLSKDPITGIAMDQEVASQGSLYKIDTTTNLSTFISGKFGEIPATETTPAEIVPVVRTFSKSPEDSYLGGTADMGTVYFSSMAGLLPGIADAGSGQLAGYVYKRSPAGTTLVTRDATGTPAIVASSLTPPTLDRPNAVSLDGSGGTAFTFTATATQKMVAGDTNTVNDVYQVGESGTTWISNTEFTGVSQTPVARNFEGGSVDGKKIYFSSTEKLVGDGFSNGDLNTVSDIYEYDAEKPSGSHLSRVAVSDPSCASATPNPCNDNLSNTGTTNASAAKFSTVSNDGSHVFFISGNILNPSDTDGQQSLYVRDVVNSTTTYIAPVGIGVTNATNGTDAGTATGSSLVANATTSIFAARLIRLSPDGKTAAFILTTNVNLPAGMGGPDTDGVSDLYVWRQGVGVRRVRQGVEPDANTTTVPILGCAIRNVAGQPRCRTLTDTGSEVFFQTTDSLLPADTNSAQDVYAVSPATGQVTLISPPGYSEATEYVDNSASGNDVFLTTNQTLDPSRDVDGGFKDLYDARAGGGLAPPSAKAESCNPVVGACQGSGSTPPAVAQPGRAGGSTVSSPRTFSVAPIGRLEREQLAKTGKLIVRVAVSDAGKVKVRATAGLSGNKTAVASGAQKLKTGGTATIALSLSKPASLALEETGKLRLRLEVSYSGVPKAQVVTLRLHRKTEPGSKKRAGQTKKGGRS